MKPGRELDAKVAEKIMGWDNIHYQPGGNIPFGRPNDDYRRDFPNNTAYFKRVLSYSIDIAAAWEVVEEMAREGWRLELEAKLLHQKEIRAYAVTFDRLVGDDIERVGVWEVKTVPLAICLAALKVFDVEVKDGTG